MNMFVSTLDNAIRHLSNIGYREIHVYPVTVVDAQPWIEDPEDGEPVCVTYEGAKTELESLGINIQNVGIIPKLSKGATYILGIDHRENDQIYLFGVSAE